MELFITIALFASGASALIMFIAAMKDNSDFNRGYDAATEGVEERIDVAFRNGHDEGYESGFTAAKGECEEEQKQKRGWILVRKEDVKKAALKKY